MISIRPPGEYRSVRLAAQALLAQQIAGITHHDSFATGEQFEPTPDDLPSSSCKPSIAKGQPIKSREAVDACSCAWEEPPSWTTSLFPEGSQGILATHAAEVKKRSAEVKAIAEAEQEKKRAADYHGSRAGRGLPKRRRTIKQLAASRQRSTRHESRSTPSIVNPEDITPTHTTVQQPQSTGYAAISKPSCRVPIAEIQTGSFVMSQQAAWIRKAALDAKFIPYNPDGLNIYDDKTGALQIAYAGVSVQKMYEGGRKYATSCTGLFHGTPTDGLSKRDVQYNRSSGIHSNQQPAPCHWQKGRDIEKPLAELLKPMSAANRATAHRLFPQQAQYERPTALFGGCDMMCVNCPPVEAECKKCHLPTRCGSVTTQFHVDCENDVCRCCQVTPWGCWSKWRNWLCFPELGIMLEIPPGVTVLYGSSLLIHGNINIADHLSDEEMRERGYLYTKALNAADAEVEVRWSAVAFSQGSTRRRDNESAEWWTMGRPDQLIAKLPREDPLRVEEVKRLFSLAWPDQATMTTELRNTLFLRNQEQDQRFKNRAE